MFYIAFFLLGYLVFFTCEKFEYIGYRGLEQIFFIWNNIAYGSILGFLCLYKIGNKKVKSTVLPVLIFSCVMFVWEIVSLVTGIHINNKWADLAAFLVIIFIVVYYMAKDFSKIKKSS